MKEYTNQFYDKRLIFPSYSFTAKLSPFRPPSQRHGQQRYTQFSSVTTSSASLLPLPAHTSVCVLDRAGTVPSTITRFQLITPGNGHSGPIWTNKQKNPEAKNYVFPCLFKFVPLGAKSKAGWFFWAFAFLGQWKEKYMKVWLREWAAFGWFVSSFIFC